MAPWRDASKLAFRSEMDEELQAARWARKSRRSRAKAMTSMESGHVVIAAITSCTNTSNPYVMIGAGLVAKQGGCARPGRASPGSRPRSRRARRSSPTISRRRVAGDLDKLGFNLVGYGCTTCIGNSGPLPEPKSPGRSQEGRPRGHQLSCPETATSRAASIPDVRANYLASPPLVVAYALAGTMTSTSPPIRWARTTATTVFLKDIWPSQKEDRRTGREQTVDPRCLQGPIRRRLRCRRPDLERGIECPSDRRNLWLARAPRPTCRTRRISRT